MNNQVQLEDAACPMGCERNDEIILIGHDRLHGVPGDYTIVICRTCGLMRTNPRPTPETMGVYYPEDYGPYVGTQINSLGFKRAFSNLKQRVSQFLRVDTYKMPSISPGHMLEIGCASGGFLKQMNDQGWTVEGIEFSESASRSAHANGFSVYTGRLESAPDPSQKYDMVVGWMVLEHLHEPLVALNKLHRWTKPDAWLVISVPNSASFQFSIFKSRWYPLHLPAHLYHFTPKTLDQLLHKSGWEIKAIFFQKVMTDIVGSLGFTLSEKWPDSFLSRLLIQRPGILNGVLYPVALFLSLFGQTARMTVWAKRIDF